MRDSQQEDFIDLERIAEGDGEVMLCVYKRYRDQVYGFAYRMLGVQSLAEDVTHEAFLVLIEHPEKYQPERGSILTFLCMIARSRILNRFRRRAYEAEDGYEEQKMDSVGDERQRNDPLLHLLDQELEAKVNESIALLPPLQREVIILRKFQELSYYEISVVTGAEISVVKARLHRARQTLARRLKPYVILKGEHLHELRRS